MPRIRLWWLFVGLATLSGDAAEPLRTCAAIRTLPRETADNSPHAATLAIERGLVELSGAAGPRSNPFSKPTAARWISRPAARET